MAVVYKSFEVRNSTSTPAGRRMTGLTPTWILFVSLTTGASIAPTPTISEVGLGIYRYGYDPEANGEAVGQIDAGTMLTTDSDRYISDTMTRDSSRILMGISATGLVQVDMAEIVPASPAVGSVGESLDAATVEGEGRWVYTPPTALPGTGSIALYDTRGNLLHTLATTTNAAGVITQRV